MKTHSNPDEKLAEDKLLDKIFGNLICHKHGKLGDSLSCNPKRVEEARQAILTNFVSKDKVREALGENEWAYDENSRQVKPRKNSGMWGRNKLRASARSKLGIEE